MFSKTLLALVLIGIVIFASLGCVRRAVSVSHTPMHAPPIQMPDIYIGPRAVPAEKPPCGWTEIHKINCTVLL